MAKFKPGFSFLGGRTEEEAHQLIREAVEEGSKRHGVAYSILNHDGEIDLHHTLISDIIPNEKNFYNIGDITELKNSIEKFGLKAPLDVQPLPNGKYKLLSGERRYTAIKELVAEGKHKGIVSIIITDVNKIDLPLDEEEKELLSIITTNKTQRVYTESDKLKEVEYLSRIYDKLKNQGIDIGSVGGIEYNLQNKEKANFIGENIGVSTRQAYSYMKVEKQGNDEIKEALDDGKISINTAAQLVDLDPKEQEEVLAQPGKITPKVIDEVIENYTEEKIKEVDLVKNVEEESAEEKEESRDFTTIVIPKSKIESDILSLSELAKDKEVDEREYDKYKKLLRQLNLCILKMKDK